MSCQLRSIVPNKLSRSLLSLSPPLTHTHNGYRTPARVSNPSRFDPLRFYTRSIFPLDGHYASFVPHSTYVQHPFPSTENRQIQERDDLGPPVVPGGQEIGLGSRNLLLRRRHVQGRAVSKERLSDRDGQMDVRAPLCPPRRAQRR